MNPENHPENRNPENRNPENRNPENGDNQHPWNDDLFDRLAIALESTTRAIQTNSEALAAHRTDYRDTTKAIFESVQRLTEVQGDIIQMITSQQTQIRGLQTENRRLTNLLLQNCQDEDSSISS